MRTATWLLALAIGLGLPAISQALTITNTTTNTVLFYDNFESPSSVSTGHAPDFTYHDPIAITGSYAIIEDAPAMVVTNSTSSPDPGPAEGSNYLRIYRNPAAYANQQFEAVASSAQQVVGQKIHMSAMVNSGDANGNAFFGPMDPGGNFQGYVIAGVVNPGFISIYNGSWQNTGVPYIPHQWQRWDIDFTVGDTTLTVTVDGNTGSAGIFAGGAFGGMGFFNANGNAGSFYIDAVPAPEPCSVALLASGLLCFVCRFRRKQS